jgi:hypothetical protein
VGNPAGQGAGCPASLYAPGKQNLRDSNHEYVNALIARGVPIHTWRDWNSGSGVVIALWPNEEHLLRAEESTVTKALVAVTWNAKDVLGWAQAKGAEPLGGTPPDITPLQSLDPVVAEAIDGLGGPYRPRLLEHLASASVPSAGGSPAGHLVRN